MVQWYNLTSINATNPLSMAQSLNVQGWMNGQIGNLILMAVFFISFISFMHFNNNPKLNMMSSCFAIAILSVILRLLSLVPDFTPFFCWGLFAVSGMIVIFTK